jgi:hypothetical protein
MKRIKFILPLIAGFMLFSCSDYLDINKSPNNPDGNAVTPDLSLATAQSDSYRNLTRRMNEYGNVFMNNWGANVNSFTGGYAEEFGIFVSNNFYDDIWDGVYRSTGLYSKIINHPAQGYDNHKAIAKICKAFYFQYLVDLYGDVPYFDVHKGVDNVTPKYDDDKAIYRDLVKELEGAITMIQNGSSSRAVGTEDVILKGDMTAWVRFANTLKLRILLRQSELTDSETVAYLATEFGELANASFVDADVTINPGYSSGSDSRQNPWMNLMVELKKTSAGAFTYRQAFNFRRASSYIATQLNSTGDGRRQRIFAPLTTTSNDITGVTQGDQSALNGGGTAPSSISSLGPGLVKDNSQDGYMMLRAESLLLQAEAVHKGYLTGNARTLVDGAITASYATFGATNAAAYIGTINNVPGKGYGALGAIPEQQLEAIFYQKDVALNGINGAEIFIEYTRARKNGNPLIDENIPMPLNSTTPTGKKPRRLMYPISEYASNSANVPVQTIPDAYNTAPFWFK